MAETKNVICDTTTEKYKLLGTNYSKVVVTPYKKNTSDVIYCYLILYFANSLIIDERKSLIGELIIKFNRITNSFINKKEGLNTQVYSDNINAVKNNLDFYVDKNGDLIITGEQSEVDRYSINSNGELIWQ